jgi:hypothetical protein
MKYCTRANIILRPKISRKHLQKSTVLRYSCREAARIPWRPARGFIMPATLPPAAAPAAQIAVVSADWASADLRPPTPPPGPPKAEAASAPVAVPAAELTDPRIKHAVAETILEAPAILSAAPNQQTALRGDALSADKYAAFSKQFSYAKVPDCFGRDALKFQPPQIGSFMFTGLAALPFLVVAAARGKCN